MRTAVNRQIVEQARPYIGCQNYSLISATRKKHHFSWVPPEVDSTYLQGLLTGEISNLSSSPASCSVVEPQSSRMKKCGVDHPQGQGSLFKIPCEVTFQVIIPIDIVAIPFFAIISFGIHTHIPPPPSTLSNSDIEEVVKVLRPMLTPQLTRSQFLNSTQLQTYLQLKGFHSIEEMHIGFANKDKISRIMKREKLLQFPFESSLGGVHYEWRTKHQDPETAYIQQIFTSSSGNLIICLFKEQASILLDQDTFQMDMSYKRLYGAWAEILIVIFHPQEKKLITLGRIITDKDTTEMYQVAITNFFQKCEALTKRQVLWRHIHSQGFYGTTVDMCNKQMTGLGRYLQSIDPYKRDWRWQLRSCIRFCQVHLQRSIHKACKRELDNTTSLRLSELLQASTAEEYFQLANLLSQHEPSEDARNWAIHKKNPVIAAGIVQCCSEMSKEAWEKLESHSNAAEQAGQKGYKTGKHVSILEATRNAHQMDLQDMKEFEAWSKFGIRHNYRTPNGLEQRYLKKLWRGEKRVRNASRDDDNTLDDDEASLAMSDSTGYVSVPIRNKRARSKAQSQRASSRAVSERSSPAPFPSSPPPGSSPPLTATQSLQPQTLQQKALLSNQALKERKEKLEVDKEELAQKKALFELQKAQFELEKEMAAFYARQG